MSNIIYHKKTSGTKGYHKPTSLRAISLTVMILLFSIDLIRGQTLPVISYAGPQTYIVGNSITNLAPTNTGGAVPARAYGAVATFAGSGTSGSADGMGTAASFNVPFGMAVDATGNVYVADSYNNLIRKISTGGLVSTLAGSGARGLANGIGTSASFNTPTGVAVDGAGNVFVADEYNNLIRKISPAGVVTTLAGSGSLGSANGTGTAASFSLPYNVAVDPSGNVYVADRLRNLIRKISPAGVVTTLAGSGTAGFANGTGTAASFNIPLGVTVDAAGNVYVADGGNNMIRLISPQGVVSTLVGSGAQGYADGLGTSASLNAPSGITFDAAGNAYVADGGNNLVRRVSPTGVVTTLAGSRAVGPVDGVGAAASFNNPSSVAADGSGNIYVVDNGNNLVRSISLFGYSISPALPAGLVFDGTTGTISGKATVASAATVYTISAFNLAGSCTTTLNIKVNIPPPIVGYAGPQTYIVGNAITNLIPTSTGGSVVSYSIGPALPAGLVFEGTTGTISGNPTVASAATVYTISAFNASGNGATTLNITVNPALPVISYPGPQTYIVGNAITNLAPTSTGGQVAAYSISPALPTGFIFNLATGGISGTPSAIAVSMNFTITATNVTGTSNTTLNITVNPPLPIITYPGPKTYSIDSTITKLVPTNTGGAVPARAYGAVTTFAGSGASGSANGTGTAASFNVPFGMAVDATGNVYVADSYNNLIRKISPGGVVSTLAGSGGRGSANGTGTAASFNTPTGVAVDGSGNIFVADAYNNLIRRISPAGVVTTFAGSGSRGSTDGTGTAVSFSLPYGVAVDASGYVYVADRLSNLIRKISPAGVVTTLAGSGTAGFVNGTGTAASFNIPFGVALDASKNVYVADGGNNMIRLISPLGVVSTLVGSGAQGNADGLGMAASLNFPSGIAFDAAGNAYVADGGNNLVRRISPTGLVTTLAGSGDVDSANGIGAAASFNNPSSVAADASGNVYVVDAGNDMIRSISVFGYSISPALPTGLVFDGTTGTISGKATVASVATVYTIIAFNASGSDTTALNITVSIPPPIIAYAGPQTYVLGSAITNLIPTNTGGKVDVYSISPALPTGLSLDTVTGIISGTPSVVSASTSYSITATNISGSNVAMVTIMVVPPALPTMPAQPDLAVACGGLPPASTISFSNGLSGSALVSGTSNTSTSTAAPSACGGTVTETWTATDVYGRTLAPVSRTVTVRPAQLPTMSALNPVTISLACGGSPVPSYIPFSNGLSGGCSMNGTSDASTFVTVPNTCGSTMIETWTASDACGRAIAPVSRTITVSQNLGAIQDFVLFSGTSAVSNTGSSTFTGSVGSNMGVVSGFDAPTTVNGSVLSGTALTAKANTDLLNLYIHLSNVPITNNTHPQIFGNGETISAGIYLVSGAGSLAGTLTLDGQGNPNAICIIRFNGAFAAGAGSTIVLANGLQSSNVFWISEGAITIGTSSTIKGTVLAHNGAATMNANGNLEGRLLSTVGAVGFGPGNAYLPLGANSLPIICVKACTSGILGTASNFAVFSSAGAVSNSGASGFIGNIGTGAGAISGFVTPSTLIGSIQNGNSTTAQAGTDLQAAYAQLVNTAPTNSSHAPAFGNDEVLPPGVYQIAGATSVVGNLTLDGLDDPNAVFIFKIGGAFNTAAQSRTSMIRGTRYCNVFWAVEGTVGIGAFSSVKGSVIANNAAITMGANTNLEGRLLSTAGAINTSTCVAYIGYSACGETVQTGTTTNTNGNAASATPSTDVLVVYPNPNKGVFNFNFSGDKSKVRSIEITDMLGKRAFFADRYQSVVYLNNQVAGLYVVKIRLDSKIISYKVFINK